MEKKKVLYYYAIWEIWWLKWLQSNIGEIAEIFIYTIQLLLVDRPSDTAPWARCRHEWHQRVDHSERWLVQWRSCTLEDWSCKTWWDWIYVLVSYRNILYILTVASPLFGRVFDKSNNGINQPFYWIGIRQDVPFREAVGFQHFSSIWLRGPMGVHKWRMPMETYDEPT